MNDITIEISAVKVRKGVWLLSATYGGREFKTEFCGYDKRKAVKEFREYVLSKI